MILAVAVRLVFRGDRNTDGGAWDPPLPSPQGGLRRLHPQDPLLPQHAGAQGDPLDLEAARDTAREVATTDAYVTSRRERRKVEMLFAHLKRILKLNRLRLRGPCGARDRFLLAATAQNLRKLAKLIAPPPRRWPEERWHPCAAAS